MLVRFIYTSDSGKGMSYVIFFKHRIRNRKSEIDLISPIARLCLVCFFIYRKYGAWESSENVKIPENPQTSI